LKGLLIEHLTSLGHEVVDLGTHSSESVDYPDFGAAVGESVCSGETDLGVCVCGTGMGIAIAANKVHGVRAAVVHDVTTARLAREHNNANVICLGRASSAKPSPPTHWWCSYGASSWGVATCAESRR